MADVTKELLDDIFASVDAVENADRALNSCDEDDDSDLDTPKPLPPPTQPARPAGLARPVSGASKPSLTRAPLRAAPSNRVTAEPGRGGRIVYSTNNGTGDAHYFMVQW
jgi:hypothetical protein